MSALPPVVSYYGSKTKLAPLYPRPKYRRIVEPFAGGASYSRCYPDHDVLLVDKHERLIAVWQYLIAAKASEIRAIPLLGAGQSTDDLHVCQEARWLVGWWLNAAVTNPRKTASKWARTPDVRNGIERDKIELWGPRCRERIASVVDRIRHWRAVCASFESIDISEPATWHVDAPYEDKGERYIHPSSRLDFEALGAWCRSLPGQVMVCENEGASWLPFEPLTLGESCTRKRLGGKSIEVLWTNDGWRMPVQQLLAGAS